jgi:hypothetical protein
MICSDCKFPPGHHCGSGRALCSRAVGFGASSYALHRPHGRHDTVEYDMTSAGRPIGAPSAALWHGRGRNHPQGVAWRYRATEILRYNTHW